MCTDPSGCQADGGGGGDDENGGGNGGGHGGGGNGGNGGDAADLCAKHPEQCAAFCKEHPEACAAGGVTEGGGTGLATGAGAVVPQDAAGVDAAQAGSIQPFAPKPPKPGGLGAIPGVSKVREAAGGQAYEGGSARAAAPADRLQATEAALSAGHVRPPSGAREPEAVAASLDRAILLEKSAASSAGRVIQADAPVQAASPEADAAAKQAESKLKSGEFDAAIKFATLALEKDPANVKALRALVDGLYRKGDFKRALEAADRWIGLHPEHASAHHRRAAILEELGERDAALEELRVAAGLDPSLRALYEAAKRGGRIRYPDEEAEDLAAGEGRRGTSWLLAAGAAAAAFFAAGLLAWRRRRNGLTASEPAAAPAPFADKFETLRVLERAAGWTLVEAKDRKLERSVLIRRVPAGKDAEARRKAVEALRAAGSVRHRALLDVYEVFENGDEVCVVTELPGGTTAGAMLAQAGRFPLAQAVRILEPVCEALEAAHARGVFHRRLSPGGLVVTAQGAVKIADLGAEASEPASPEEGRRADVRGLAACLYEMATGARPFEGPAAGGRAGPSPVPPSKRVGGLPESLDELIADALAATPSPKVRTAGEFLSRLREASAVKGAA